MRKLRIEKPFLVHAVAYCDDCRFKEENYEKAVESGRKHAYSTGHSVVVETGYCKRINLRRSS